MITFSESQQKIVDALSAVSHAHWIDKHNGTIICSHCHTWFHKDDRYSYMRYCPYCNVKMVESEEVWNAQSVEEVYTMSTRNINMIPLVKRVNTSK